MENPYPLSQVANQIQRSVTRELIALASRPDFISFAGGLPAADHLPLAEIEACLDAVLTRDGARALQYGPPYPPLREWIAGDMQRRGVACSVEQVFITNGAQQALEIMARLLLDPGQPAVLEALTFTGIIQVARAHAARVRTAPLDLASGVDPAAFEAALTSEGAPARMGIIIPDFHNPVGASLTLDKRQRLAQAAARTNVPLVEDDPYSLLRFAGDWLPPVKAFDEAGRVFYISSFSKIIAPAMRLGWIVAPVEVQSKLAVLRESLDLESSQLLQRLVTEFVSRGCLEPHLQALNAANQARHAAMRAALEPELGVLATWTEPEGGLFMWVTLAEGLDAAELLTAAFEQKLAYIPGANFSPAGLGANTLRLNYSNNTPERIAEGVRRLGLIVRQRAAVHA